MMTIYVILDYVKHAIANFRINTISLNLGLLLPISILSVLVGLH